MKNLILFLVLAFSVVFTTESNAQVEKGRVLLGTTVNLSGNLLLDNYGLSGSSNTIGVSFGKVKNKSDFGESEADITSINFSPQVGYFITDGIVAGVSIDFSNSSIKDEDDKFTYTAFQAGPFVRYYFALEKVHPYIFAGATFGTLKNSAFGDTEYKNSLMNVGGGAGLAVFLSDFVSFDFLVGYNYMNLKDNDSEYNSEQSIGNVALDVGFTFTLGPKESE